MQNKSLILVVIVHFIKTGKIKSTGIVVYVKNKTNH